MSYSWRLQFRDEVNLTFNKTSLHFYKSKQRFTLSVNPEFYLWLKHIENGKHLTPVMRKHAVVKLLFSLALVESVLVFRNKDILTVNSIPPENLIKKWTPVHLSSKCYFEHVKNNLKLKHSSSTFEITFHSSKALDLLFTEKMSVLSSMVASIMKSIGFLEKKEKNGWHVLETLFHERTAPENFFLQQHSVPARKFKVKKVLKLSPEKMLLPERKSRRTHGTKDIPLKKISSLFYNLGKKENYQHDFFGPHYKRNYPSAGGAYDNEFYLVSNNCEKLEKGIYFYEGSKHSFQKLDVTDIGVNALLDEAGRKIGMTERPQSVIFVTSKIFLLQKKYSRIPYRLALLNAGVVTAQLDFMVNHLGLAGCPTGASDWRLFAKLTGIDSQKEMSVMEYVLGTVSDDDE